MKNANFFQRTATRRACQTAAAVAVAVVFLFPIYWLLQNSLKQDNEIFLKTPTFYPHAPTLEPWVNQLVSPDFLGSLRNSFCIATLSLTIASVLGLPAAYGLARFKVPFKKTIILVFLVSQMMPSSLLLTPLYLTFSRLRMLNTFLAPALSISGAAIAFMVITLRPSFMNISKSLDEAARMDGCGPFRSFILIMLPLLRTALITVAVFSFLFGWNDLVYSMTFNVREAMRPLTANIYKFMDMYGTKWNYIMAYGMILVLPVILLFTFLQKYIVGGISSGGVKE